MPTKHTHCIYCNTAFGATILYHKKVRFLHRVKEHFYPHNAGGGSGDNLVWSCQICNMIKRDLVFETIFDAQNYILDRLLNSDWKILE